MAAGIDFSWDRPDPGCVRDWGYEFIMRYVGLGSLEKLLSTVEARIAIQNGLSIVSLAEAQEGAALGGYGVGYDHATRAFAWARLVGMPEFRPIYFAVDFDAQDHQMDAIEAYLRGAQDAIGVDRVGVYGGIHTINAMANRGAGRWYYQTYAWSYGQWSPYAHVQQYQNHVNVCGATVDLDRSMTPDFGQWGAGAFTPTGSQSAPPLDTGQLPDVQVDGPWDYTPHLQAHGDTFSDLAQTVGGYARALDELRAN